MQRKCRFFVYTNIYKYSPKCFIFVNYVTLLMVHLASMIDNTKSSNMLRRAMFLLFEISDLSDKYLKTTYVCTSYKW